MLVLLSQFQTNTQFFLDERGKNFSIQPDALLLDVRSRVECERLAGGFSKGSIALLADWLPRLEAPDGRIRDVAALLQRCRGFVRIRTVLYAFVTVGKLLEPRPVICNLTWYRPIICCDVLYLYHTGDV